MYLLVRREAEIWEWELSLVRVARSRHDSSIPYPYDRHLGLPASHLREHAAITLTQFLLSRRVTGGVDQPARIALISSNNCLETPLAIGDLSNTRRFYAEVLGLILEEIQMSIQ